MWNPRVGGEKCSALNFMPRRMGSPPHRPGKDIQCTNGKQAQRITPAWAGKRSKVKKYGLQIMDHPRAGGEKLMGRPRRSVGAGSPPHRRGKGHGCHQTAVVVGITPAWAGKSCWSSSSGSKVRDHPRVGGEKELEGKPPLRLWGSPPRGRGKGGKSFTGNMFTGITPAWAGKRQVIFRTNAVPGDHPRVGGEKIPVEQNEVGIGGSPPRGRGKAFLFGDFDIQRRITPAWAGKSEGTDCARAENGDHPRVGGEKAAYLRAVCGPRGSPPRGRGKARGAPLFRQHLGITPAWAGKRR